MKHLSKLDNIIVSDIGYFGGNGYRFTNSQMAKKFGVSRRAVIYSVQRLKSFKLIVDVGPDEYHRRLKLNGEISALFDGKKGAKSAPVEQTLDGKKIYPESSEEFKLAKLLFDEIRKRKPDFKEHDLQAWARHIGLMIRKDERKPARIAEVILWCQADSGSGSWQGWQNNILSTKTLREKFDKLEFSMAKSYGNTDKTREYSEISSDCR